MLILKSKPKAQLLAQADGIARIHGLSNVMQGEMIEFQTIYMVWRNLEQDSVEQLFWASMSHCLKVISASAPGESWKFQSERVYWDELLML